MVFAPACGRYAGTEKSHGPYQRAIPETRRHDSRTGKEGRLLSGFATTLATAFRGLTGNYAVRKLAPDIALKKGSS